MHGCILRGRKRGEKSNLNCCCIHVHALVLFVAELKKNWGVGHYFIQLPRFMHYTICSLFTNLCLRITMCTHQSWDKNIKLKKKHFMYVSICKPNLLDSKYLPNGKLALHFPLSR